MVTQPVRILKQIRLPCTGDMFDLRPLAHSRNRRHNFDARLEVVHRHEKLLPESGVESTSISGACVRGFIRQGGQRKQWPDQLTEYAGS